MPFWSYANAAVKTGNIWWNESLDLGSQFIGSMSFYTIGSPFFWLSLLVPARYVYLAMPVLLALKFGVAGLTGYAWLRRYTKTEQAALLGAVLYAFCGFQISNQNFNHFADVVALFPLLLLTLDMAVEDGRRLLFGLAVGLCCLCSWFSFFGEAVFLVLYLAVKLWCKKWRMTGRLFGRLAAESALGVGLAAVLLLPSLLFNLANPRTGESFAGLLAMLVPKPIHIADLVRGLLFPAEVGFYRGFYLSALFNSGELYLPLFGIIGAAAFLLYRRKGFEARLLGICVVFMVVPILNSAFVGFNAEYYTRWFFMPTLILCLATARTVETPQVPIRRGVYVYLALWGLLGLVALWFILYFKVTFVYNLVIVAVFVLISASGAFLAANLRRIQKWRPGGAVLLALVLAYCFGTQGYNIYNMQKTWVDSADPKNLYTAANQLTLPESDTWYRVDADGYHFYNLTSMTGHPGLDAFSSTVNGSIFAFYDMLGLPRSVISEMPDEAYPLRAFLSAEYWVRYGAGTGAHGIPGWQSVGAQGSYHLYRNEYYIPLGYTFGHSITYTQLEGLPQWQKYYVLTHALVVDEAQSAALSAYLTPLADEDIPALTHADFEQNVALRRESAAHASGRTKDGYLLQFYAEEDELVFLSIPYDRGWTATVNGAEAEIHLVSGGFMAVAVPAGGVVIELVYRPQGFAAGLWISLASALLLGGWAAVRRLRRAKDSQASVANKARP